jgi:hypothetical protein
MLSFVFGACAFLAPTMRLLEHVGVSTKIAHGGSQAVTGFENAIQPVAIGELMSLLRHIAVSTKVAHSPSIKAAGFTVPEPLVAMSALLDHVTVSTKVAHPEPASAAVLNDFVAIDKSVRQVGYMQSADSTIPATPVEEEWSPDLTIPANTLHLSTPAPVTPASTVPMDDADMAFPTFEDLQDACVLVSEKLAMCSTPSPTDDTCSVDQEMSDWYGEAVYACKL